MSVFHLFIAFNSEAEFIESGELVFIIVKFAYFSKFLTASAITFFSLAPFSVAILFIFRFPFAFIIQLSVVSLPTFLSTIFPSSFAIVRLIAISVFSSTQEVTLALFSHSPFFVLPPA